MTILRQWQAEATREGAASYAAYFDDTLRTQLAGFDGFLGADLDETAGGEPVKITVSTRWRDRKAMMAFAGSDPEHAVIEDAVRPLLISFDDRVTLTETPAET